MVFPLKTTKITQNNQSINNLSSSVPWLEKHVS